jgi:TolB-like protein/Tfp pilus assembly protein PilF/predicted Ser/Thr protein kinase
MTGRRVGPYEVGEKLGEGGMGVVYRALDTRLRRNVALKILSGHAHVSDGRRRFLREAQTSSALNHPGIVTIYDLGEFEGDAFIVMEYVEGKSLRSLIGPKGLDPNVVVVEAIQMADALAAAHATGIVHRDLKPGNIMVTTAGKVKILDFGLAIFSATPEGWSEDTQTQITEMNTFVGTVDYVSPEQSMGRAVDYRSDIFSLAVVVQEMLTGGRPFSGKTKLELLCDINRGTPKRLREVKPELPWSLEALLLKMLEKRPEDRIESMVKVRESLAAIERELQHKRAEAVYSGNPDPLQTTSPSGAYRVAGSEIGVAVLRFRAVSPGPEAEAFAAGLLSETIQAVGGIPRIQVASRVAVDRFEDGKTPIQQAAMELGVSHILSGTVRQSGERVRVLCELSDALTGIRLWSRAYQSEAADPFDAQESIARSMAAAVSGALLTIGAYEAPGVPLESLDAPALVRRAHMAVFAAYSKSGIEEAVTLVRQAITVAPNYGPAHAYLGLYLQQRVISGFSDASEQERAEALAEAELALQLAPFDAEVLQNAGLVLIHQSRPERAMGTLRRAVEIAEFNLVAWGYLGLVLGWTGGEKEMSEAQAIFDRMIRDTPDHRSLPYWLYFKAGICFRQGKYAEALECTTRCAQHQPQFVVGLLSHANALCLNERYGEAMEVIGRVLALSPGEGQEAYIRELTYVACSSERVRPHIAGLVAAGIFKDAQAKGA